jgi:peptidoglycan/xylan/chitin deacetylase (PgdA/CDA1 family)
MKAVMYHYVRSVPDGLPYFRYLHLDDFRRQLDHLAATFGIVSREAFLDALAGGGCPAGVVLTFDDGFADHAEHVLPELLGRGLWGIFFVPTGPYATGTLLDVHRIHLLVGRLGGRTALAHLEEHLDPAMLAHGHVEEFQRLPYARHDDDEATTRFKRILNYFVDTTWRPRLLDRLMAQCFGAEAHLAASFYLTRAEIRALHDAGMLVGSHTATHPVLSTLDLAAQAREIDESFGFLDAVTGGLSVRGFCYPYGGFHTFTADTERLLAARHCRFAFNVEPRDVEAADLRGRPLALPRYDCNVFPFGRARMGAVAA